VICVRGTPGALPEVRTISLEEYRTELELDSQPKDAGVSDADVDPPLTGDDEDAGVAPDAGTDAGSDDGPWTAGLQLIGLLAEDPEAAGIESALDNVSGYYEASRQRITLIDRGSPQDGEGAQKLLAHELVHALQDQEFGLRERSERVGFATDASLASSCLIEGEADLYEELAWSLLQGFSVDPGYWDLELTRHLKFARRSVVASDSAWTSVWLLRYPIGTRFVLDAWLDGGNAAVRMLHRAPPNSSIYFMHGYGATHAASDLLVRALRCDRAAPPAGFEPYRDASLGPLLAFAFLGQSLRDGGLYRSEELWRETQHWRQDSFTVFTSEHGALAVSWRVRFDDAALAQRLAAELAAALPHLRVQHAHDEIEVLASDDAGVLAAWPGTGAESCPPPPP
jgi:hypothetical protein